MAETPLKLLTVQIVTVSTRAAAGEMADRSGPLLAEGLAALGLTAKPVLCIPDDLLLIQQTLLHHADFEPVAFLAFTGGTGPTPDDCTPDALAPLLERTYAGLATALHTAGSRSTERAILSRTVVGTRGRTLIAALPGSPGGVQDALTVFAPVLFHLLQLTQGLPDPH